MPNKQQENTNKPMSCVATVKLTNMQKNKTKKTKKTQKLYRNLHLTSLH